MNWVLFSIILAIVMALIIFIILRILDTYQHQVTTGEEDLKGKTAVVKETLNPQGTVFYQGDLWTAISNSGPLEPGEEVIISKVEGLKLIVTKKVKE